MALLYFLNIPLTNSIDAKSRWFVGSSNINMSGFFNNNLANDTLVFCPP